MTTEPATPAPGERPEDPPCICDEAGYLKHHPKCPQASKTAPSTPTPSPELNKTPEWYDTSEHNSKEGLQRQLTMAICEIHNLRDHARDLEAELAEAKAATKQEHFKYLRLDAALAVSASKTRRLREALETVRDRGHQYGTALTNSLRHVIDKALAAPTPDGGELPNSTPMTDEVVSRCNHDPSAWERRGTDGDSDLFCRGCNAYLSDVRSQSITDTQRLEWLLEMITEVRHPTHYLYDWKREDIDIGMEQYPSLTTRAEIDAAMREGDSNEQTL